MGVSQIDRPHTEGPEEQQTGAVDKAYFCYWSLKCY